MKARTKTVCKWCDDACKILRKPKEILQKQKISEQAEYKTDMSKSLPCHVWIIVIEVIRREKNLFTIF